jgi:hypothetical protein
MLLFFIYFLFKVLSYLLFLGAAIAGVYRASVFEMPPIYALVWGVGQTVVVIFISFTRILATL